MTGEFNYYVGSYSVEIATRCLGASPQVWVTTQLRQRTYEYGLTCCTDYVSDDVPQALQPPLGPVSLSEVPDPVPPHEPEPEPDLEPRFTDTAGSTHADAIEAVAAAGVAGGYGDADRTEVGLRHGSREA